MSIREAKPWLLSHRPQPFKVRERKAPFAVVMVVGADSDLVKQLGPDVDEMIAGVSERVSVLLLVDLPGPSGGAVVEVTPRGGRVVDKLPEFSTGDPTVLANFFTICTRRTKKSSYCRNRSSRPTR